MMLWYDKLAFAGIAVAFCGWMMFITGFGFMLSANRQARAEFRTSLEEARGALRNSVK